MYQIEIDRFKKKIDEQRISSSSKTALYNLVEKFFSNNYQNISEKHKKNIELEFDFERTENMECIKDDFDIVLSIVDEIKITLFTILDTSVKRKEVKEESFKGKILDAGLETYKKYK